MRIDLRHALFIALLALGSALLALAAIDWFAYAFAGVDHLGYERRLHAYYYFDHLDRHDPLDLTAGRAVLVFTGLGLVTAIGAAALARILRPARTLLLLAAVCTALAIGFPVWTTWELHTTFADIPHVTDPDTGLRSLARDIPYELWRQLRVQPLGVIATALLLPTLAVAAVRTSTRRGASRAHAALTAAALALPLTVAALVLTLLWLSHGDFAPTGHERWADLIGTTRPAPIIAALLVALFALFVPRGERRPPLRNLLLATLLLALGVSAALSTAPHRRTIDTLYPLRAPGEWPFYWQPLLAPWRFDAPPAAVCVDPDHVRSLITFSLDESGEVVVSTHEVHARVHDEPEMTGLLATLFADLERHEPSDPVVLLVDRRIPLSVLTPALARVPWLTFSPILIAGTITQPMPTAEGPAVAVILCVSGQLGLAELGDPTLPADATWGTITDDPARVHPVSQRAPR